ncbi:INS1B protein, partial [Atractosteus spatula]|nr:INS1B protein [Atractosteus spatula]
MTSKLGSAALSGDLKRPAGPPPPPPPPPKRARTGGRDAVTTSPVLGLRITEGSGDGARPRGRARSPLGEFVCQLCRERYADPLSLAQHGCSRIVRVEYRCADCDKAFSCPANLASHRRWHKPRGAPAEGGSLPAAGQPEERHPSLPPPSSQSRPDLSPPEAGPEEELLFDCPQCGKKFRRQAYLRKHLALHARQAAGFPDKRAGPSPGTPPAQRGGGGDESPAPAGGELHPCRFCAETFFSCPGLTRHLHACHPTQNTARAACRRLENRRSVKRPLAMDGPPPPVSHVSLGFVSYRFRASHSNPVKRRASIAPAGRSVVRVPLCSRRRSGRDAERDAFLAGLSVALQGTVSTPYRTPRPLGPVIYEGPQFSRKLGSTDALRVRQFAEGACPRSPPGEGGSLQSGRAAGLSSGLSGDRFRPEQMCEPSCRRARIGLPHSFSLSCPIRTDISTTQWETRTPRNIALRVLCLNTSQATITTSRIPARRNIDRLIARLKPESTIDPVYIREHYDPTRTRGISPRLIRTVQTVGLSHFVGACGIQQETETCRERPSPISLPPSL